MEEDAKNVDGFMKVAKYWASRHDGRREFEWKVAFGWWGLIVLAIHYVHSCFLNSLPIWLYVVIAGLVASMLLFFFIFMWLYPLWKANDFDKKKSIGAVRCAEAILGLTQSNLGEADNSPTFAKDWSMQFQAVTTGVLLIVLCIAARY